MLYYTYFTWHRGRPTRIFAPKCQDSSGVLYRPMSSDITLQDFPFTEGQIFRNCRLRKQEITNQNGLRTNLFYLQMHVLNVHFLQINEKCIVKSRLMLVNFDKLNNDVLLRCCIGLTWISKGCFIFHGKDQVDVCCFQHAYTRVYFFHCNYIFF